MPPLSTIIVASEFLAKELVELEGKTLLVAADHSTDCQRNLAGCEGGIYCTKGPSTPDFSRFQVPPFL